jgi:hypothetical protein
LIEDRAMPNDSQEAVRLATSFAGESLVPGGANLLRGDIVQGGLHVALGFAARALFGLPGLAVVSANSLVKATTGRHLTEHLGFALPTFQVTPPPPLPPEA